MPDILDYPEQPIAQPTPAPVSQFPDAEEPLDPVESAAVKQWTSRIQKAKMRWQPDFERMRANQEFAYGFQYNEQSVLDDDRYIANMVLKAINRSVAQIYARNPQVEWQRRPRRDYALWDGKLESLAAAVQGAMTNPYDLEAQAVIADFVHGQQWRKQVEAVGDTLAKLYQWHVDMQQPSFKKQLKKLVRRVRTCGVGYVKLGFERLAGDGDAPLTSTIDTSMMALALRAQMLLDRLAKGELEADSPAVQDLRNVLASLAYSTDEGEQEDIQGRLTFDFPRATSIIPDWRCQSIEDFEGCKWIAEEYIMPLSEVNAFFETQISVGGDVSLYQEEGEPLQTRMMPGDVKVNADAMNAPLVAIWEVWDINSKSTFVLCKGWPSFVAKPGPVAPCTRRFWPVFSMTFNAVEVEAGLRASIFPPSDVQLMKSAQKERNRSRQALRRHRRANAPRWMARAGSLDSESKRRLMNAREHSVTEVNTTGGEDVTKIIAPVPVAPLDPMLYDTNPSEQDVFFATGSQQADIGPAEADVTATVGSIAAQAKQTETSSEVDDIDELLSDMAEAGGELLLKEQRQDEVMRIVGPGAVWPVLNRRDFLNELFLKVKAASTGRPNKAIDLSNWQIAAPVLQQAGANPMFMVKETLRRLDDQLDAADAFPLVPTGPTAPGTELSPGGPLPAPTAPYQEGQQPGALPAPAPKAPRGNPVQPIQQQQIAGPVQPPMASTPPMMGPGDGY